MPTSPLTITTRRSHEQNKGWLGRSSTPFTRLTNGLHNVRR
jgi:hypothetical protein